MQQEELELQREELVATREELKRAAEAQTASSEALAKQIDVMQLTARLNALNSLFVYYNSKPEQFFDWPGGQALQGPAVASTLMIEVADILAELKRRGSEH